MPAGGSERTSHDAGDAGDAGDARDPGDAGDARGGPLAPSGFVHGYRAGGVTVLELRGEIDLAALPEVLPYIDQATSGPRPRLVIDLRPVTFLDCSGLRLLVRARVRVTPGEGEIGFVCDHPGVLRILRAGGLLAAFRPVATLAEALGGDDDSGSGPEASP